MTTWSPERSRSEAAFGNIANNGYPVPGSRKKSMKGVTATANSPDSDIIRKLDGMRALSRDGAMSSPLSISILRRHKIDTINSGLQVQARIRRQLLGLTEEQAVKFESEFEADFDMWSESLESDYRGELSFMEQQALAFLNMLVNGDFFYMLPWRERADGFPYELSVQLIDADLVRNPQAGQYMNRDIKGGVEKDSNGRVVAYHVWDTYPGDIGLNGSVGSCTRVPVVDDKGKRQIWHVYDPERINQRRGIPLLAPVADTLRQLTRLADSELMASLVASFFTVFVKDQTGLNPLLAGGMPSMDTLTGGGVDSPTSGDVEPKTENDGNDLEMGYANVIYLDDQKDIELAEARNNGKNFADFWESLVTVACSGANMPKEKATMHYNTSFVAAKAAANDAWNVTVYNRTLIKRRFCDPVYTEFLTEAALRNRYQLPGFFDDHLKRFAWTGSAWVGIGQGYLNPLQEAKASVVNLNSFLTTHEDEHMRHVGGRWDSSMERRAREKTTLETLGLNDKPDQAELIGPDGQQDDDETENALDEGR